MITKLEAIRSLDPNAHCTLADDVVTWMTTPISEADIATEQARLQAEYDSLAWERNRKAEYPSIEELVVALYDSEDRAAIDEKRAAVKLKHPKGG